MIIVGGGIGGLAAALALANAGLSSVVLERRDDFSELGAGIQLGPNAFRALERLKIDVEVRSRSCLVEALRLMNGLTGEVSASLDLGLNYANKFEYPYAVVRRTDLYGPLVRACVSNPQIELRTSNAVLNYSPSPSGVQVRLQDGTVVHGDALIGADGIHSTVRRQMLNDGGPSVSGHTIFRSVVPADQIPATLRLNQVVLWAGPGWHFVHYPIDGGASFNLAATVDNGATESLNGVPVDRSALLAEFPGLHAGARELLGFGDRWRKWVLMDRDPTTKWVDGRVALLGDAAHPMLQYLAQGACMALEDAVILGDAFEHVPSAAFSRYSSLRVPRANAVQLMSRQMGQQIFHAAGLGQTRRDERLSGMDQAQLMDAVAWLHGARDFSEVPTASLPDFSDSNSLVSKFSSHQAPAVIL